MAVMEYAQDSSEDPATQAARRHLDQQEYVKALKAFTRLAEARPSDEEACLGKVLALRALNRPRGALKACEAARGYLPGSEALLAHRDDLAHELGPEEVQEILLDLAPLAAAPLAATEDGEELVRAEKALAPIVDDGAECTADVSDDEPGCPASQQQSHARRAQQRLRLDRSLSLEASLTNMASEESAAYRDARKDELVGFYREFYGQTRAPSVDTSQYSKAEKKGLSIDGGHRPMPRPEHVELPADYKQPVGMISATELAVFGAGHERLLISVHGDLFDVSDRPDKYGSDGPYHSMAGHDITWALWSGYDDEQEWDKYFDLHQAKSKEERDRRFQGLMSWWAFYEQEYGSPVGRLEIYEQEWRLPAPPQVQDVCSIM